MRILNVLGHKFKITQDGPIEKAEVTVDYCDWTIIRIGRSVTLSWTDGSSGDTETFVPKFNNEKFELLVIEAFGEIIKDMSNPMNWDHLDESYFSEE